MNTGNYYVAARDASRLLRSRVFFQRYSIETAGSLFIVGLALTVVALGLHSLPHDDAATAEDLGVISLIFSVPALLCLLAMVALVSKLGQRRNAQKLDKAAHTSAADGEMPRVTYMSTTFCTLLCDVMIDCGGRINKFNSFVDWFSHFHYDELARVNRLATVLNSSNIHDTSEDVAETIGSFYRRYKSRQLA